MSEDGEKDQEKDEEAPSRPVTASARRKQRSSDRAADKDGDTDESDDTADEGNSGSGEASSSKRAGRAAPRGKAPTSARDKAGKPAGKNRPTPKRDSKPKERESLFARARRFLREVWAELRKVVWPTRKQMVTYTSVVLVFLAFMIALVFGLDFVFGEAISVVFGR